MTGLTTAQRRVLEFVQAEISAGRPIPTLREIAARFGFKGHRAAAAHLDALKRKGFIASEPGKARSLHIISPLANFRNRIVDIPLFGSIPAGLPQSREQDAEGCVSVDVESIGYKPTRNAFALRVTGDSMIGRHILNGDFVILEHGPEPRSGQVVAALVDGASTLKTFVVKGGKPYLKAENPKYPDLIPAQELMIQGVVKALIRRAKD
ncbi:MAG TPA: transcriptional repressor LexA [Candidatus Acidoferrales bacterium]|nr:transcriptional repressor LexA [Candidatus Acidoferrales bacterium]